MLLDATHTDTVTMVDELLAMTGNLPAGPVFSSEYDGAEKSLWDSLITPAKSRIASVRKEDLVL